MGYPIFGKVKTITLPIPANSMTFAEYKNAFGIDLQHLENTELILLKESSGDIVPVLYYDKENAVLYTANYSCDISAGFEVETDSLISKVIADGTIENAKPIYWHGLNIGNNDGEALQVHILNNNDDAISSLFALKNWFESISGTVDLSCCGVIKKDSAYYPAFLIRKENNASYKIFYIDSTTGYKSVSFTSLLDFTFTYVQDAVNKVN